MPSLFRYRRHRFDALHALLTGTDRHGRTPVPPYLRRDVGLPETPETHPGGHFAPALGIARQRD